MGSLIRFTFNLFTRFDYYLNQAVNQGRYWVEGGEVPDDYMVQVIMNDGSQHEIEEVSSHLDYRLPVLLRWLYNYQVHRVPGMDVVAHEELVFIVLETTIENDPWCATLTCFDIWEQQNVTFKFTMATRS